MYNIGEILKINIVANIITDTIKRATKSYPV